MAKITKTRLHYEILNILNGKRKEIKQFGKGLKENPTRRSSDITDQEVNVAAQILQLSPNGEQYFLKALKMVFSNRRAERLLEKIIDNV